MRGAFRHADRRDDHSCSWCKSARCNGRRIGVLNLAHVEYGVRVSEALRRLGWRLVRWKHH